MGIEFNHNVNKINMDGVSELKGVNKAQTKEAIIKGSAENAGMGVTIETNQQISDLMKLFENVPDKPEFNIGQKNLVILGAVMSGATEEMAEI